MDTETFLIEHLADIERAVAFVCRRHGLHGAEAEDFGSMVKLKMIDNDYAVIRKFEARCSFHSYVVVVATRLLLDERNHEFGKWRPSTEAKRLGETAVQLETLLHRDKRTVDEAAALIRAQGILVTRREIEEIVGRLPLRRQRPRQVPLDALGNRGMVSGDTVTADAEVGERLTMANRVATVLRGAMARLPEYDRSILRMRFEADMTIAEIARALRIPQKPIYRLLETHLKNLRHIFEREGIRARDVESILGIDSMPFDRKNADPLNPRTPTLSEE